MASDGLTLAVRQQLSLGRLLPLGPARDSAWLTERAARGVLLDAAQALPGVRVHGIRLVPAAPGTAEAIAPAGPRPPGAPPPGPVRIEGEFSAAADRPLPEHAERLRGLLAGAADDRLGLTVTRIDLHVAGLLEDNAPAGSDTAAEETPGASGTDRVAGPDTMGTEPHNDAAPAGTPAAGVAEAVLTVPGVRRLSLVPGDALPAVWITDRVTDGQEPPSRQVRVQVTVDGDRRVLDVAREARDTAATRAAHGAPGPVAVAVLVTHVEPV